MVDDDIFLDDLVPDETPDDDIDIPDAIDIETEEDMELPDGLLGSTTNMKFTLDNDGYAKVQKKYSTGGWGVDVTGTITDPDGITWTIEVSTSAGTDKTFSDIATNESEDLTLKTNVGKTTVTVKIWSANGADDAGVVGHLKIKY
tara:strand:+ start:1505 stop:1939 length:435 start_codon:yes stop_codon:yes gene_type:complete